MIRRVFVWAFFVASGLSSLMAGAGESTSRLNSLVITGCENYTPEMIRKKLAIHPKLAGSEKLASDQWMTIARDLVLSGYRSLAYADASVTIVGNELQVIEGPRYRSGEIRIEGVPEAVAAPIRECLLGVSGPAEKYILSPSKTNEAPLTWVSDTPTTVDEPLRSKYQARVEEIFEQEGLFGTNLKVDLEQDSVAKRVHLVIRVTQLADASEVGEILFEGLTRHSSEEILDFLKLKPGPFSLSDKRRVESQLRETGRFLSHRVDLIEPFRKGDPHSLLIHVKECSGSPVLSEPLNQEQTTLLKTRNWLERFGTNGHQLAVTVSPINEIFDLFPASEHNFEAELILSPTRQLGLRLEARTQPGQPAKGYLLGLSDQWISLASYYTGRQLVWHRSDSVRLGLVVDLHGIDKPFEDQCVGLNFGQSFSTKSADRNKPPLWISIAPAALFYRPPEELNSPLSITSEGTQLHVKTRMTDAWLDAGTGRPDRVILRSDNTPTAGSFTIETRPDEVQANWNQWLSRRPMQVMEADKAPASTIAEFLVGEWNVWAPEQSLGRTAALKLIQPELLTTIDRSMLLLASSNDEFYIPGENHEWWADLVGSLFRSDTEFLRPNSTASALFRALMRVGILRSPVNLQQLIEIAAKPDCGPLNCMAFGSASAWLAPPSGPIWGQLGLSRLSEEAFQADLEQWLHEDQQLGQTAIRIVRRMQSLSDEEAGSLSSLCRDPESARILAAVVIELRKPVQGATDRERDVQELARFRAALTRLWAPVFRPLVAYQLQKLAGANPPIAIGAPNLQLR